MARPSFIVHWRAILAEDDAHYPNSDELLSIGSPLARATGLHRLGVHHELLPPGRRTSFPHAEKDEEELVFVLEGAPDAWIDGEIHRLAPGDCVGFPAGTGIAHTFINDTDDDVRLLVVGERIPGARVHYPLHPDLQEAVADKSWTDAPLARMGPHDGLPRARRGEAPTPARGHVPTLETERLVLRKLRHEDAEMRREMRSDPEHVRYLLVRGAPTVEEARASLGRLLRDMTMGGSKGWAIVKRGGDEVIGQVGLVRIDAADLRASLVYEVRRSEWGAGYGREAVARVVRFGFDEMRLHRIQAEIDPRNLRSRRLVASLGFIHEGTLRGNSRLDGEFFDDAVYALLRGES